MKDKKSLLYLQLYEVVFHCNKVIVSSFLFYFQDFHRAVTRETLNYTNVWNCLRQKSRQGKIRNLRLAGTLKLSLEVTNYIMEYIYVRSLWRFLRFEDFGGDFTKCKLKLNQSSSSFIVSYDPTESAKLCVLRAKKVLTCQCALRP